MKSILILICLFSMALLASDVILYNPTATPITNRVTRYLTSQNTPEYVNRNDALIITNRVAQTGPSVTLSNLIGWCVVDGQLVRLMTQAELDRIAATNAILAAEALAQTKYDARLMATNVVNGTDGLELYLRAAAEANWFYINQIRTNLGYPALTRGAYKAKVEEGINAFGQ